MTIQGGVTKTYPFSGLNLPYVQALINSLNFRVVILDSAHTVLLINSVMLRQLPFVPKEVTGKKCPHFVLGKECPMCPLEKASRRLTIEAHEYYDPQSQKWFRSVIYPLPFFTDSKRSCFGLIIFDITDKKALQKERDLAAWRYETLSTGTIEIIQNIIAAKDVFQPGHPEGVAQLAEAIAVSLGLPPTTREGLVIASRIHDLGKITIPAEILTRTGKMAKNEYNLIKTHPKAGYDILKNISFPYPLAEIVYQHHERIDGSGYPRGLKGSEMLIESKIIAVAEVVDAMTSHRPYRDALTQEEALRYIEENRGTLFDPEVVDACLKLFREDGFKFDRKAWLAATDNHQED